MIAVLFGTFNAKHAANALLAEDLRRAGVEVRICHAPLWEEERDKHAPYFSPGSLARLGLRWLRLMGRLALRFQYASPGADLVVAGFNGQLDVLVARLLARGRRVVFAPLVTISETLIDDRARYAESSVVGHFLRLIDRASLAAADVVLLDTRAHRDYVVRRFRVPAERVAVQYLEAPLFRPEVSPLGVAAAVAAGTGATAPAREARSARLDVLAYGTYLPLHGTEVVARAARMIAPDEGIHFELIGSGPERATCDALVRDLAHVTLVDWVDYDEMPARIRRADVVLGIFGSTEKARMVIPNKIYQAAQVGRAIVSADTPAPRGVRARGVGARDTGRPRGARRGAPAAGGRPVASSEARRRRALCGRALGRGRRSCTTSRRRARSTGATGAGQGRGPLMGRTPLVVAVVVTYEPPR